MGQSVRAGRIFLRRDSARPGPFRGHPFGYRGGVGRAGGRRRGAVCARISEEAIADGVFRYGTCEDDVPEVHGEGRFL